MAQFSLSKARPFPCNKGKNPSRNKLCQEYTFTLVVAGATDTIVDVATWQDKGAGRDWYEAKESVMGFKMYKHQPEKYNSNETEMDLWNQHEVIRANTPRLYGQFVVDAEEHNCDGPVRVNVLVQDKVGPSLGNFLSALCADDNSWNHATALQVVRLWSSTLALGDELASCRLGWAQEFCTNTPCLSLSGGRMLLCDWVNVGRDLGPVGNMKLAIRNLARSSNYLPLFSDSWRLFHKHLFSCLRESLDTATVQINSEWWLPSLSRALTEYGPPLIVMNNLQATGGDTVSLAVGASVTPLPANHEPDDTSSGTVALP